MFREVAKRLVVFGVQKLVEARFGDDVRVDTASEIANILSEKKDDIKSIINNYKRNNSAQTAETAAEDFMNALDANLISRAMHDCDTDIRQPA